MAALGWIAVGMLALAGLGALRQAWKRGAGRPRAAWLWGGWSAVAAAVALGGGLGGFDRGAAIACCLVMTTACILIAATADIRTVRARAARPGAGPEDPLARPFRPWRAAARVLVSVGLATTAAFAVALVIAFYAPAADIDRMITAAWLLPLLWGAALAWGLSDEKLLRPTAGLTALTIVGGLAVLMGAGA